MCESLTGVTKGTTQSLQVKPVNKLNFWRHIMYMLLLLQVKKFFL